MIPLQLSMMIKRKIKTKILDHFSLHFNVIAGAFIGSRSSEIDDYTPSSDFDCFLLVEGNQGHGSEITVDHTRVHVVIIAEEQIRKYLDFSLIRCSWQFLTVMDWIRSGEIFYDPFRILRSYREKAKMWFQVNIRNFILSKITQIEILLSKIESPDLSAHHTELSFMAIFLAIEILLTYSLFKGRVFHGPKLFSRQMQHLGSEFQESVIRNLNLEIIDTESICAMARSMLGEIKNGLCHCSNSWIQW